MPVKVRIPSPLQKIAGNQREVEIACNTVEEMAIVLEEKFPGIKERIFDEKGKVRRFINVYLNDEDIRFLDEERTRLKDGDSVSIIPAIAGG